MSRLEAGGLVPQPRAFPLAEVLAPLASEFAALAADRGLVFRHVSSRLWVDSDPQLLRRVLQNFLGNAVRYTAHGGVLIGVRRAGGRVRIEVHDTGPGIDAAQQAVIFEEFRRGDGAAGQGLGLGLAIADRIAQLLHAPIALRSRSGRGTVFSITVPRAHGGHTAQPPPRAGLRDARVLVVDNDPAALAALAQLLRGWGCSVDAVSDGTAATDALVRAPADLWVFDYHLDNGDTGIALQARLAARFGARPTLIVSADDTGAVRSDALATGLSLLPKPLRPLALKSVLDRMRAMRG